jgi:hypothetical protein
MGLIYPSKPWTRNCSYLKLKIDKTAFFKGLPGIMKTGQKIFYFSEKTTGTLALMSMHKHTQTWRGRERADLEKKGTVTRQPYVNASNRQQASM